MVSATAEPSSRVTSLVVFVFFGATSFVHGYAIILAVWYALRAASPAYGAYAAGLLLTLYAYHVFFSRAEHSASMEWAWFKRSFVTKAGLEYFGARALGLDALDAIKGERVLLGLHPHGIYPMAGILAYAGASPLLARHPWLRVRPCGASIIFKVPLIREYLLWTGHLDAGRRTISKHMSRRKDDIGLVVGGEKEALLTRNGEEAVVLLGRTGFVQLAAKYGYALVPSYAFGQNEVFTCNPTLLGGLRAMLQRTLKMAIPLFWGSGGGPMPHKARISLAIGNPIRVPPPPADGSDPDPALVERLHAEYVSELRATFERHKAAAGYADRALKVLSARAL